MAGVTRFELVITDSESIALPLGYTPTLDLILCFRFI